MVMQQLKNEKAAGILRILPEMLLSHKQHRGRLGMLGGIVGLV